MQLTLRGVTVGRHADGRRVAGVRVAPITDARVLARASMALVYVVVSLACERIVPPSGFTNPVLGVAVFTRARHEESLATLPGAGPVWVAVERLWTHQSPGSRAATTCATARRAANTGFRTLRRRGTVNRRHRWLGACACFVFWQRWGGACDAPHLAFGR